jgi:Glycosyltransferase Family 4
MADSPPLRALMLAYYYPPLGGAGVQRSLKFSKYLPEFAVVPSLISADSSAYTQDASLLAEVPAGIDVLRLPHTPLLAKVVALAQRYGRRRAVPGAGAAIAASTPAPGSTTRSTHWRDQLLQGIGTLQYPDDKAAWSNQAERSARSLVQRQPFDLIFSSSPPVSAHRAAMRVAQQARLPWVADLRDLWTDNPDYIAPAWRRVLDRRLESRLLGAASGIVTVSEHMAQALARRAGPQVPVVSIPNGYDEADFAGATARAREPGTFCIVHAGTLYGQRSPQSFLQGVERLFERDATARARLRIRFVGNVGSRFEPLLIAFEARHPGTLERTGYVEHRRALAEILAADALLLVIGGDPASAAGVMTGKLFEYLRSARPILLLGAPEGEAAQLVRSVGAGDALGHDDPAGVATLLANWMSGSAPQPSPDRAAAYERRALTGRLGAFMHDVHRRFHGRN